MRFLSRAHLTQLVTMDDALAAVEAAYLAVARGTAQMPLRTPVATDAGVTLVMPGRLPRPGAAAPLAVKVVSVYGGNPERGLPAIHAVVLLVDDTTGQPLALMEGGYLTALRTGAASGVAARWLARSEARVLTVLGAGTQAPFQAEAVCAVRQIAEIRIVARQSERAEALAARLRERWPDCHVHAVPDADRAVAGADIVVAATSSSRPVFSPNAVAPGTCVCGIGSYRPDMRELPPELLVRVGGVFVDSPEAVLEEAGEVIAAKGVALVPLGAVIGGEAPGRRSADEVTVFKSVGLAVQDAAIAQRAYQVAGERGIGETLKL